MGGIIMAELTDREKKIVIIQNTIANPLMRDVPFDTTKAALVSMFNIMNFNWTDTEVTDLVLAINEVHKETHQAAMRVLDKHKDKLNTPFKL